jgi:aminomuconate-semialdehyde/2-hydroxymuconate-6-semialdehyde dehydrogenase
MGKPITGARTKDVPRTAQNLRFFADHARLSAGEALPMDSGHHAYS